MTDTQEGTSVVPAEPGQMARIKPTPQLVEQVRAAILDGTVPPEIGDPTLTARAIKERILAGTLEEALQPSQSLPGWREYMDEDVSVLDFHLNPSNIDNEDGGRGVYAVVEIILTDQADAEPIVVHCGGGNVLATLVRAWELGQFPFRCRLCEKSTGSSGRKVLWLEAV